MLGARVMTNCKKSLGLPTTVGKSMANTFKDLQEKISNRMMGWKEKFISKASSGNFDKNDGTSNPYLFYESLQVTKNNVWYYQFFPGKILVGANKGWEKDPLD